MNISPVNMDSCNIQTKSVRNTPSFQSGWFAFINYKDMNGVVRCGQVNTCLRTLDYKKLAKNIVSEIAPKKLKGFTENVKRFLGIPHEEPWKKANIYCLAGADGTEAYAMADAIIGEIGFEKAKKHVFPIYVSDVTEWIIKEFGKAGKINFSDSDIQRLGNIRKFLVEKGVADSGIKTYELKPEFRECFVFETADLQAKIASFPGAKKGEFNVFVIRNCLYEGFKKNERNAILKELTQKYPEQAMVVLGEFDLEKFRQSKFNKFFPPAVGLRDIGNQCFMTCVNELNESREIFRNRGINPSFLDFDI